MTVPVPVYRFQKGLRTKHADEGHRNPDEFEVFEGVRTATGTAKRRIGMAQVAVASSDNGAVDLVAASSQYFNVGYDDRVHTYPVRFTWEALVHPDTLSGNHYVLGQATASPGMTIHLNSSGNVVVNVWDSGGTNSTLTSSNTIAADTDLGIQVTRDGATLTVRTTTPTATVATAITSVSATLALRFTQAVVNFGRHNGADYFDGKFDYIRCFFGYARSNHADWKLRWLDPEIAACRYDYHFQLDASNYVRDRSRYENHAARVNSPAQVTALAHQYAPVTGIHPYTDTSGRTRVFIVSGGRIHLGTPG